MCGWAERMVFMNFKIMNSSYLKLVYVCSPININTKQTMVLPNLIFFVV